MFQERHRRDLGSAYTSRMSPRLRIPLPALISVFWLYHVTEVFASECEQLAWTAANCDSGLCDISTGACSTKSDVGGVCSSTDDCFKGMACLGGRCCSFSDSSRAESYYLRAGCSACGDENARGYQGEEYLPGKCLSCNSGYTYLSGDPSTDPAWYAGSGDYFTGRCVPDDFCSGADLNTEKYLYADMPDANTWIDCNNRRAAGESCSIGMGCSSGSCMGGYCCAAGVLSSNCDSGLCDISTGACSTKSDVGGVCSSTDDCFKGMACLSGRCCSFSDSSRAESYYLRAGCSACGDENARDYQGEEYLPGKCLSCNSGYTYLSGDPSTDPAWYAGSGDYFTGRCVPDDFCSGADLNTEKYLYADMPDANTWIDCNNRRAAGESCSIGMGCSSGSCMGGYCCAAGVLSSNCDSGLCDISTGACSTKSDVGGVCSSTDDCFKGMACLSGRCCSFSDSSRAESYYLRAGCSACGDENARGYQGEEYLPGKCLSCNSGYTYLSGDPSTDPAWYAGSGDYFTGRCVPDDFCSGADLNTEKYLYADMPDANTWIDCNNRRAAGESCSIGMGCSSGSCMGGYCCGYSEDRAVLESCTRSGGRPGGRGVQQHCGLLQRRGVPWWSLLLDVAV